MYPQELGAQQFENLRGRVRGIGLIARGIDGLKGAQKEVEKLGSKALVFPVDIGNADRVEAAAAQIEADLGEIDIWDQQRDGFGLFASQGDDV